MQKNVWQWYNESAWSNCQIPHMCMRHHISTRESHYPTSIQEKFNEFNEFIDRFIFPPTFLYFIIFSGDSLLLNFHFYNHVIILFFMDKCVTSFMNNLCSFPLPLSSRSSHFREILLSHCSLLYRVTSHLTTMCLFIYLSFCLPFSVFLFLSLEIDLVHLIPRGHLIITDWIVVLPFTALYHWEHK